MMPIDSLIDDSIQCNSNFHFIHTTKATTRQDKKRQANTFSICSLHQRGDTPHRLSQESIRKDTATNNKARQDKTSILRASISIHDDQGGDLREHVLGAAGSEGCGGKAKADRIASRVVMIRFRC
mmetsp:Transcript_11447/g.11159  ORF Transcript_11447/g.11159 Transcript_11447/m.11159 type:complete len:125 (-) Transcript_11447:680-1054(-)